MSTYNVSGKGENLKLLIDTNSSGVITGVGHSTIDFGTGYQVGDVVGIQTSTTSTETGRDAKDYNCWNIRIRILYIFQMFKVNLVVVVVEKNLQLVLPLVIIVMLLQLYLLQEQIL